MGYSLMAKYTITMQGSFNETERLVADLEPDEFRALDITITALIDAGNLTQGEITDITDDYVNTFLEALDKIVEFAR